MNLHSQSDIAKIAKELRTAYGFPEDAELWMRPCDLIQWQDERMKRARERIVWRYPSDL